MTVAKARTERDVTPAKLTPSGRRGYNPPPTMRHLILSALLPCLSISAPSQARDTSATKAKTGRALTEEQVQERLGEVRAGILMEVMPERTRTRELQRRRWLNRFHVIKTDHYLLFTNSSRTMAGKFAKSLEEIHAHVRKQFPFEDIDELLTCYVFNRSDEYYDFSVARTSWTREQAEATGGHSSAAMTPRGLETYYATYYQAPTAAAVRHEATHQIVSACLKLPGIGSWFQEGMAVYIEKSMGNERPSATMRSDLRSGNSYPLEEFFALRSLLSDPKGYGRRNYDHAGALIDFLVNTKLEPVAGRFPEFLKAARKARGRSRTVSERLVREVYDLSALELEELWRRHHGIRRRRTWEK